MADKITKETKRKKSQIKEEHKEERQNQYLEIVKKKEELLQEKMRDLPQYLETKNMEIATDIAKTFSNDDDYGGYTTPVILNLLSKGSCYAGVTPKYTSQTLYLAFESFKELAIDINKQVKFMPTKQSLCAYLGISVATFNSYKKHRDYDMREMAEIIDDYLIECSLVEAENGNTKGGVALFRLKAEKTGHGIKEAKQSINVEINNSNAMTREEMLKKLAQTGAFIDAEFVEIKKD